MPEGHTVRIEMELILFLLQQLRDIDRGYRPFELEMTAPMYGLRKFSYIVQCKKM